MWRSGLHPPNIIFTESFHWREKSFGIDSTGALITCTVCFHLSGDSPDKTISITDYQHISNKYYHRKIPNDQKEAPHFVPKGQGVYLAIWFRPCVILMSHLLPQSSHWLQVLQCCSQIAPEVCHPESCPEPSGRLFLLLLLRWAKVRKSHPSAGKPPIKHQKNFTSLGYVSLHKFVKNHEDIPKKSVPRPGCCFWFVSLVHYETVLHCVSVYKTV